MICLVLQPATWLLAVGVPWAGQEVVQLDPSMQKRRFEAAIGGVESRHQSRPLVIVDGFNYTLGTSHEP